MQTRQYAVIGDPIAHSISPRVQAAAFQMAGIPAVYAAVRVAPEDVRDWVARNGRRLDGFNVTVPHKEAVTGAMDELDEAASATKSVNTVACESGCLSGYNTDPQGFSSALEGLPPLTVGESAVVFGFGGAARAVLFVLLRRGISVTVVTRRPDQQTDLNACPMSPADERVPKLIRRARLLVNATPLGMAHLADRSPVPNGAIPGEKTSVMDLIYGRNTPFLQWARAHGCPAVDGTEMLLAQAAAAFTIWTGHTPNLDAMRRAVPGPAGHRVA